MRLLDRYLLRELLTPLVVCLGGFLVFWVAFDLITEKINTVQDARLTAFQIAWYYFLRLPEFLEIAMPIGLLLGLLWALTTHAKHHELTAIRAAGVSVWRLATPYLAVGFVFTVVLFLVNEIWQPRGAAAADDLLRQRKKSGSARAATTGFKKVYFRNSQTGRFWALDFNEQTDEIRNVRVDSLLGDGARQVFAAERGIRSNGIWCFYNAWQQTDLPNQDLPTNRIVASFIEMPEFSETPADIRSEIKINDQLANWKQDRAELSLGEIYRYLARHPKLERTNRARLFTKLHGRIATPWRCLVVVLIALPFGTASGRRNIFVGVASGILLCFLYFIVLQLGLALGAGSYLPAWLAAWLPNLLFGGTSVFFTFRVR